MTAKQAIVEALAGAGRPLAIHEFSLPGISQNSIGSRLPELALVGIVESIRIPGKPYKSWRLASGQGQLL